MDANIQSINVFLKLLCRSKSISINILAFLMAILGFWGCQNTNEENRDYLVFRYNEHANITSLDPAFAKDQRNIWACNQLYNSLVRLDEKLDLKADLAKSWEISEDGTIYQFTLRTDVKFHESKIFEHQSRTVNSQDVVYSLNRLLDKKIASPGSWVLQQVKKIAALNDSVVEIELLKPFPAFLGLLSMKYCSIIPVEMKTQDFRENPVGTGPFYFKRWEANEKLVFRRNNLYFEKDSLGNQLPYLEAVTITFLPDKQSEFLQFAQGKIDFISGLDPSYKDELLTNEGKLREKYNDAVNMLQHPYLNTEYIGIYLEHPTEEVNSLSLRQAINYGFDRKAMITYLRNGMGTEATHGFIPKGLPGFSEKEYFPYNPTKAEKLVTQFKQKTAIQNPEITISTNASYLDLCEYMQRELLKIGIRVNVDVMPPSTLRQQRSSGKLQMFRASWIADYPDAENYLSLFYSNNFAPNGPNYTHFKSTKFDELYEKASKTTDVNQRLLLYQQMDSIVTTQAVVIPLYYDKVVRFTQKNVQDLGINPINLLDLRKVKKE